MTRAAFTRQRLVLKRAALCSAVYAVRIRVKYSLLEQLRAKRETAARKRSRQCHSQQDGVCRSFLYYIQLYFVIRQ